MQKKTGERIRSERERIGLSQMAFGETGGVKKLAQLKYEQGERSPDVLYLAALSKIGVDVQFIVTGVRSSEALANDEAELISYYRSAPLAVKQAVFAALTVNKPTTTDSETTINVTGSGQCIAGRDFHENKK
ncbi:helix-turn-helix domain-containing protein [Providencia manganoxydans]|uniref:helix-turn-helix domain-containing protein n=1 Tax=Providencia manganoxydans TaxID=2923283 RepID=UPI0034E3E4BB